jgi:tetratricopeptide (TPR) repeat protein
MTLAEARRLFMAGSYLELVNALLPAIDGNGDDAGPEEHLLLAKALGRLGRHREAAEHFELSVGQGLPEREDAEAVVTYTATLRSLGRYFAASKVLRAAADRHKENHLFRALLALTEYKLGMYRESIDELTRLLVETTSSGELQRFTSLLLHYAEGLRGWNRREEGDTTYGRSSFA